MSDAARFPPNPSSSPNSSDSSRTSSQRSHSLLPFLILGAGALVIFFLFLISGSPDERPKLDTAPLVRTLEISAETYPLRVTSQGEVSPGREGDLIPQVSGEVIWVSPSFEAGGFFEEGDVLVRIDPADYRVDRETARAAVARSQSEFARAKKERDRQQELARQSVAAESQIDDANNAYRVEEASLREAEARLEKAERDLARTELKAPYRGRVRTEQADLGQFVTRGNVIGRIYSVDYAEVRLPLPDRELAYLDLDLLPQSVAQNGQGDDSETRPNPAVTLEAHFAGDLHRWQGELVRTEAELDARSRMMHVVARVPDPYGLTSERTAPLSVGLFVSATIDGQSIPNAFILPREALRDDNLVYIIDNENRLRFRKVDVLRTEREKVVLSGGLEDGDSVCISPLQAAIDGMTVRIIEAPTSSQSTEALSESPPNESKADS